MESYLRTILFFHLAEVCFSYPTRTATFHSIFTEKNMSFELIRLDTFNEKVAVGLSYRIRKCFHLLTFDSSLSKVLDMSAAATLLYFQIYICWPA